MIRNFALILLSTFAVLRAVAAERTFPALLADKAAPKQAEKLATFGQFVGSWTFEGVEYHDDGTRATDRGELHFRWILQGEAIQDVWIETDRSDDSPKVLGTTLRFYDPKTDTWSVTWVHPRYATVRTLTGRQFGPDIVIDGTSSTGTKYRWIFSEIQKDSFRWHAETLTGTGWKTTEELHARRMTATSAR